MNWFVSEPVSTEALLRAGLPVLEVFCAFVAIIAVLLFLIAFLHTVSEARSSSRHLAFHLIGEAKQKRVRFVLHHK